MIWLQTSVAIKRVVLHDWATLFSAYDKNGFIEESYRENDTEVVKMTFFKEVELDTTDMKVDALRTVIAEWIKEVEGMAKTNGIHLYGPIDVSPLGVEHWLHEWKEFVVPVEILPGIVVAPLWKKYNGQIDDRVIYYDTDLSFGTGMHDTTQSCAQLFAAFGKKAQSILDIGTGTGILLLVAKAFYDKLDKEQDSYTLTGIDIDNNAVLQAIENMKRNETNAHILEGNLLDLYDGKADLILANLTVTPLIELLKIIPQKMTNDGILIISGVVEERREEMEAHMQDEWQIVAHVQKNNWHSYALQHT